MKARAVSLSKGRKTNESWEVSTWPPKRSEVKEDRQVPVTAATNTNMWVCVYCGWVDGRWVVGAMPLILRKSQVLQPGLYHHAKLSHQICLLGYRLPNLGRSALRLAFNANRNGTSCQAPQLCEDIHHTDFKVLISRRIREPHDTCCLRPPSARQKSSMVIECHS